MGLKEMVRPPIKILFNVWADAGNMNAQSLNARDIALRLDTTRFQSNMFVGGEPDPRVLNHPQIRLIQLPPRCGSLVVLTHLIWGRYDIVVYPPFIGYVRYFHPLGVLWKRKKLVMPVEGPIDNTEGMNQKIYHQYCGIIRKSDVVVPISEYLSEWVQRETGVKPFPSIPVGVDTSFFTPGFRNGHPGIDVVFVGRLIQRKGPDFVLEAARVFPRVEFSLVGTSYGREDSTFASELKRRTLEEGLSNVRFLGKLLQADIRKLMQQADILLLPSRVEGIPKVTLEAAATGLPCIVFEDYRTPSVINGVTGFQTRTSEEMIDRLRSLIENETLRRKMGAAAVEHARKFDWNLITKQWEDIFERTVTRCN